MGTNRALSPLKTALAALVSRGDLDDVVDIASLDAAVPNGPPLSAVLVVGRAPLAVTQGLAAARVPHALELTPSLCDPSIGGAASEPVLALAGQLAGADAVIATSASAVAALAGVLSIPVPESILAVDSCLVTTSAEARPITACVLIGPAPGGEEPALGALSDVARKSGVKLHRMERATPEALADAASFCAAYPHAAVRILQAAPASPIAAVADTLDGWNAAYRMMGAAAWDVRALAFAEWTEQPKRAFAPTPGGLRRFDIGRLVDDLAAWFAAAASGQRISLAELRLLGGLVPRRTFGGALRVPRPAPAFVVAPPQSARPDAMANQDGPGTLSLRALATPLPADARGLAWRESLVAQLSEAERFLEERGLFGAAGSSVLPSPAPETELRMALSNVQAELRASDALVDSRLVAMQAMDQLIRERDATIAWQARSLDERWEAMAAMTAEIKRLSGLRSDDEEPATIIEEPGA